MFDKSYLTKCIRMDTLHGMNTIQKTDVFDKWLSKLQDIRAKARIFARINQAEQGNFGDHKFIADNLYEMRIHYGPGYRIYYTRQDDIIYLLLVGGDKSTQQKDISKARALLNITLQGDKK